MTTEIAAHVPIPYDKIEAFCRKWRITRFELFGSAVRDDFDLGRSDIDVLVTFAPGVKIGLDYFGLSDELALLFGRKVDLATRRSVERSGNRIRREAILSTARTIYES